MERIDENTWRTDNGDEIRAQGLRVTVEFGEKTKAELLCAVKAVREENDRLRELVRVAHACKTDDGCCEDCWGDYGECPVETEMRELGIEVGE